MLKSVDEVIKAVGGATAAAAIAGVGLPAVSNWRTRGRISRGKFLLFRDALASKNETISPEVFGMKTLEEARA